ncbi:Spermine/spermidine acetyltransferase [bioreactor metagenome]|uniref:Spermine/spermidine acetyltransferase n=1 Tax=bioreactor metagenome TaxID=1076179 RepID=A0A645C3K3_9ZZZZ
MDIHFEIITPDNWRTFNKLKVNEEQKEFVASNLTILARAYAYRDFNSQVYAIYNEDIPIGLLMQREYEENNKLFCVLDQFMITEKYQRMGYGKAAMKVWIDLIKKQNRYNSIVLCYIEGDEVAKKLYLNMGFYHTGEVDGDEIVMKYIL